MNLKRINGLWFRSTWSVKFGESDCSAPKAQIRKEAEIACSPNLSNHCCWVDLDNIKRTSFYCSQRCMIMTLYVRALGKEPSDGEREGHAEAGSDEEDYDRGFVLLLVGCMKCLAAQWPGSADRLILHDFHLREFTVSSGHVTENFHMNWCCYIFIVGSSFLFFQRPQNHWHSQHAACWASIICSALTHWTQ